MNESIRSFIAIPLPFEIQKLMGDFALKQNLTPNQGFRPVKPGNIHITIKFLGEASVAQLRSVSACLARVALKQPSMDIVFEGIGAFPNWNQPRVIWAGITAPPVLESLYAAIDQETVKLGFASENRRFSPHLTLARIQSPEKDAQYLRVIHSLRTLTPSPFFGKMRAEQVILYKSVLQTGGSVYTPITAHQLIGERDV